MQLTHRGLQGTFLSLPIYFSLPFEVNSALISISGHFSP